MALDRGDESSGGADVESGMTRRLSASADAGAEAAIGSADGAGHAGRFSGAPHEPITPTAAPAGVHPPDVGILPLERSSRLVIRPGGLLGQEA